MCYYKLFVFQGCGHSLPSAQPVRPCAMASATDRQNFEERRQAAEGRTMKRRPQGLVTDRKVTSAVCTPAQHPDTAAEHSSATSPPPSIQTQPPTEDRQLGNEGDIPGTSSTTPTSEMPVTESSKGTCTTVLTHPFQTTRLHRSCLLCTRNREELLAQSELAQQKVRIDDWRWKVKYLSPVPEEARHTVRIPRLAACIEIALQATLQQFTGLLNTFQLELLLTRYS
ncbi:unnamed protein product [Periconia digitata]|uniref:Uncharacterized protein n=1 Tax=Periconia digitata TaxID=1303443 RepID=A0A9W4UCF2_9PLEO|nr:unnamed protein product [Periconia digitata]